MAQNADAQEGGMQHGSLGLCSSKKLNETELCGGLTGTSWVKQLCFLLSEIATQRPDDGCLNLRAPEHGKHLKAPGRQTVGERQCWSPKSTGTADLG